MASINGGARSWPKSMAIIGYCGDLGVSVAVNVANS
jgi:hypothetical protein